MRAAVLVLVLVIGAPLVAAQLGDSDLCKKSNRDKYECCSRSYDGQMIPANLDLDGFSNGRPVFEWELDNRRRTWSRCNEDCYKSNDYPCHNRYFRINAWRVQLDGSSLHPSGWSRTYDGISVNSDSRTANDVFPPGLYRWTVASMRTNYWDGKYYGSQAYALNITSTSTTYVCVSGDPTVGPALLEPASASFFARGTQITFKWSPVSLDNLGNYCSSSTSRPNPTMDQRAQYRISLRRDGGSWQQIGALPFNTIASQLQLVYTPPNSGFHEWRVAVYNGDASRFESTFSFGVCDLGAPSLSSPANGFVSDVESAESGLNFGWTHSWSGNCPGTPIFTFQLVGPGPVITRTLTTTSTSVASTPAGSFQWSVTATIGPFSKTSSTFAFSRCIYAAPTAPVLQEPLDNVVLYDGVSPTTRPVTFKWSHTALSGWGNDCSKPDKRDFVLTLQKQGGQTWQPVVDGTLTEYSFEDLDPGTYSWMVYSENGHTSASPPRAYSFTIGSCTPEPPTSPTLQYPENSSVVVGGAVTLTWVLGYGGTTCSQTIVPDGFTVALQRTSPDVHVYDANFTTDTSLSLAGLPAGQYQWSITYQNTADLTSTATSTFSVCHVSSVLAPVIATTSNTFNSPFTLNWADATPTELCGTSPAITYSVAVVCSSCADQSHDLTLDTATTSLDIDPANLIPGNWTATVTVEGGATSPSTSFDFIICAIARPPRPTLAFPAAAFTSISPNVTFSWQTVTFEAVSQCSIFVEMEAYQLVLASNIQMSNATVYDLPSGAVAALGSMGASVNATIASISVTDLGAGVWYWLVRAIKTIDGVSYVSESPKTYFSVCREDAPESIMAASPVNGSEVDLDETGPVYVLWTPLSSSQYGIVCSGQFSPSIKLYLSTDPDNLVEIKTHFSGDTSSSDLRNILAANTTYYWRVDATNGVQTTVGTMSSFTTFVAYVPPTEPPSTPTLEPCQGDACTTGAASNNGGAIAGIVIGVFAALMVAGLILFFVYARRRRQAAAMRLKSDMEMDDTQIVSSAFVVPAHARLLIMPKGSLNKVVEGSIWRQLQTLITADDFVLVYILLDAMEQNRSDDVSVMRSLVYLYHTQRKADDLLRFLISREVRRTEKDGQLQASTLFRQNSLSSAAFTAYARVEGIYYLLDTLSPFHREIITQMEKTRAEADADKDHSNKVKSTDVTRQGLFVGSFEMDPNRLADDDDQMVNKLTLELMCQRLINLTITSSQNFPSKLRNILHHVRELIGARISDSALTAVGGFVFLRMINPAIVTPTSFGLMQRDPDPDVRRQLIMITKVLQNLANSTRFKEAFMESLNVFIEENAPRVKKFLTTVSDRASIMSMDALSASPYIPVPDHVRAYSLAHVHKIIYQNLETIQAALNDKTKVRPEHARPLRTRLADIMQEIGEPCDLSEPSDTK